MPTRQIGWNVSEIAFAVMYVLVALQAVLLAYGGTRRYLMWRRGRPYGPIDRIGRRPGARWAADLLSAAEALTRRL